MTMDRFPALSGVTPDLLATVSAWDQAAWCLAALAVVAGGDGPPDITEAAQQLLKCRGITTAPGQPVTGLDGSAARQIASQAAAPLHQASALASGRAISWSDQSDAALLAQGQASALGARAFAEFLLPEMGDLADRLAAPGARMLDAGTGVAAMAVAFAQVFPRLRVLGIDVLDRPLALARRNIAASDVTDRVMVRKQDVAGFADDAGFDLAYLPAPFIPPAAMNAGLPRVVAALRPGGWLFIARGKMGGIPAEDALTRLKTLVYGGTALDDPEASALLSGAGLTAVRTAPTPAGAPGITIGQKP